MNTLSDEKDTRKETTHGNLRIIYKMQAKSCRNIFRVYQKQDNFSTELEPRERVMSQTSFGHISTNSSTILTVVMATESPWKDLSIDTSHASKRSVLAEILGRLTSNHYGTVY